MADAGSARRREGEEKEEEDDVVCLDPFFFVDRSYEMTTFTFGSQVLNLLCLRAASRKVRSEHAELKFHSIRAVNDTDGLI